MRIEDSELAIDRLVTWLSRIGPVVVIAYLLLIAFAPESAWERLSPALLKAATDAFIGLAAFAMSWRSFRTSPTPRRSRLRALGWLLGIAAFAALRSGYQTDEDCVGEYTEPCPGYWESVALGERLRLAASWLVTMAPGVILSGLFARNTLVTQISKGGPDLSRQEALTFFRRKLPDLVILGVAGALGLGLWLWSVAELGLWGFLVGTIALIGVLAIGVMVTVFLDRFINRS